MRVGPLVALPDEGADRGRRRVEDVHPVLLDQPPETVWLWPVGSAFVHEGGRAGRQRSKDHIRVSGDPADICGTPIDIVITQVENPVHGGQHLGQVAAR